MTASVLNFPSPQWMLDQIKWTQDWEEAVSYYSYDTARRCIKHMDWWDKVFLHNQHHAAEYPKSFTAKVIRRYGADKAAYWVECYGKEAVEEIFAFHEFMDDIRK